MSTSADPGARSMGFGGAFVALADDATAAFANPAGLVQLAKPEISIEARNWQYSSPYTVGGRAEGLPSGFGLDSTVGLRTAKSRHDTAGLSFLSLAYPTGNWSFAFYRHQYADMEFSGATQGLYGGGTSCCQIRNWDARWTSEIDILNYGLSAGYRINDRFNIGLGAVYFEASMDANVEDYFWDEDSPEGFISPNSYLPESLVRSQDLFVDDTDWTVTGGFLWRLSERWTFGGVYREGFEVDIGTRIFAGQLGDWGVPPGELFGEAYGIGLEFPDIYGLGFAYRHPDGHITVSFQWDRVEYSDIPDSLMLDDQTIDDANEYHAGIEYVFLGSTPIIALRFGAWYEPDHQMHATIDDPFLQALIPRRDDEIHVAAGLGFAMERFQVDVALDVADSVDTVALSAIFNF